MHSNHLVHFEFPHRMNRDGTIDSICPRCFSTIGRSTWEADLDRMEAAHLCEPARLASFNQHRRFTVVSDRLPEMDDLPNRSNHALRTVRSQGPASTRKFA